MQPDIDQLQTLISREGMGSGLRYLNQRVPHRYTAIYRLDHLTMRNMYIVDKKGAAELGPLEAVPIGDSFCQFAMRDGEFVTSASGADQRLGGHPYQGVVGSYVGLPLMGTQELYGTFCHFDLVEQPIEDQEFLFLQRVARMLPRYL